MLCIGSTHFAIRERPRYDDSPPSGGQLRFAFANRPTTSPQADVTNDDAHPSSDPPGSEDLGLFRLTLLVPKDLRKSVERMVSVLVTSAENEGIDQVVAAWPNLPPDIRDVVLRIISPWRNPAA